MRQIAGAFARLEKARLVGKLRHARRRIRKDLGHYDGHDQLPPACVRSCAATDVHRSSGSHGADASRASRLGIGLRKGSPAVLASVKTMDGPTMQA